MGTAPSLLTPPAARSDAAVLTLELTLWLERAPDGLPWEGAAAALAADVLTLLSEREEDAATDPCYGCNHPYNHHHRTAVCQVPWCECSAYLSFDEVACVVCGDATHEPGRVQSGIVDLYANGERGRMHVQCAGRLATSAWWLARQTQTPITSGVDDLCADCDVRRGDHGEGKPGCLSFRMRAEDHSR